MVTVYSTASCPQCYILKTRLAEKGIEYQECHDEEKMHELGIQSIPVLEVEGKLMNFPEAFKYVSER